MAMALASQPMADRRTLILSDQKPGHFYQSTGLAQSMKRLGLISDYSAFRLNLQKLSGIQQVLNYLRSPEVLLDFFEEPDELLKVASSCSLIIETGSSTAAFSVLLKRMFPGIRNIHILKPQFFSFFDLILLPEHDYSFFHRKNVLRFTTGFGEVTPEKIRIHAGELKKSAGIPEVSPENAVVLLLGGNSRDFTFDIAMNPIFEWIAVNDFYFYATDSRRTPADVSENLGRFCTAYEKSLICVRNCVRQENPLPGFFGLAERVLVSEDSFSMLSEAVESRAAVGVLVSRKNQNSKLRRSILKMASAGMVFLIREREDLDDFLVWKPSWSPESEKVELIYRISERLGWEL